MEKGKVRIVGDGTPWGTKVFCGDVDISDDLISIEISKIDKNNIATATITVLNPELDLELDNNKVEFKKE